MFRPAEQIESLVRDRNTANAVQLRFRLPSGTCNPCAESFFLGAWHPNLTLHVMFEGEPTPHLNADIKLGRNWVLLSTISRFHSHGGGMLHTSSDSQQTCAFRGYLLDPPFHTYSPREQILSYWVPARENRHNGVFSFACVDESSGALTLTTDAFGMGPLYYRCEGRLVLFSTNPKFLMLAGDSPDYIAWRSMMHCGFIASNRALTNDVHRVPPGSSLRMNSDGLKTIQWYDFGQLPAGTRPVDEQACYDVEDAFQATMSKCLQLKNGQISLPLSSGHDSRRILASLVRRRTDFNSYTVRVFQKEHRDLDATFTEKMAREFEFRHQILDFESIDDFVAADIKRRMMVDAECPVHTWAIKLMEAMPSAPCVFLDGIVGDILGNPGFRISGLYQSLEKDCDLIINQLLGENLDGALSSGEWPPVEEVREDLRGFLQPHMQNPKLTEIAFILLRQRRSTSLWSQQLVPSGHIVVCPYLDLEYVNLLMSFRAADRHKASLQRLCLSKFWPEYAKFPGNRDIPSDMPPGSPRLESTRWRACVSQLQEEIVGARGLPLLLRLLTWEKRIRYHISACAPIKFRWRQWYLRPLMELVSHDVRREACWTLGEMHGL